MKITDKNVKKSVFWIAKSYYCFEESINSNNSTKEKDLNMKFMNEFYYKKIRETFENSVNENLKMKTWQFFYNNKKVENYEKIQVKKEIEKWHFYLAQELGLLTKERKK